MAFKECTMCGKVFHDRDEFLKGSEITLIGYMVDLEGPERGLLLFNHLCGTTLAIPVWEFLDFYQGPKCAERKTGGEGCPGHCLNVENIEACLEPCSYAFVRSIMQVIRRMTQQDRAAKPELAQLPGQG